MELRKKVFALGPEATYDDSIIKGCRLPTISQVVRCVRYLFHVKKEIKSVTLDITFGEIKYFYDKAKIPMLAEKSVKDYIWQAYDHNVQFRRSYHSHRLSEKYEKEELERMEKTFVAWPKKTAMKEIKNETDRNFLSSMMTDRKATIGGKKIHKCFA